MRASEPWPWGPVPLMAPAGAMHSHHQRLRKATRVRSITRFGRAHRRAREVSATFAAALGGQSARTAGRGATLVGLEHEYQLLAGDTQVDFRGVIRSLMAGQPHLDPGDPYAYRTPSGAVVTCDQAEAEIVLPPMNVQPHFTVEIDSASAYERRTLQSVLPRRWSVEGYSTHISVSIPGGSGDRLARQYARTFAPALMLLMDRTTSPGMLVRPRPGRLELCGEFVDGGSLRAATAFAVGSVLACLASRDSADARAQLPPQLLGAITPAFQRYGWYVRRDAFGNDLYQHGRTTVLAREEGGHVTAQEQLEQAWATARHQLEAAGVAGDDLDAADAIVEGRIPLPSETDAATATDVALASESTPPNPFGSMLDARARLHYEVAPVMATWDLSIFLLLSANARRTAFACVPRRHLPAFLIALDSGGLDPVLTDYLETKPSGRRLLPRGAANPGLWDELPARKSLLAAERRPEAKPFAPKPRPRLPQLLPAARSTSPRRRQAVVGPRNRGRTESPI